MGGQRTMPGGKAHGKSREYQVFTQNVLRIFRDQEKLEAYDGDGIDVPIKLGFATFTFDVALKGSDNRIVVAECKAYSKPGRVKQGDIAEFANKVTLLRTHTLANVGGEYFSQKQPTKMGLLNMRLGKEYQSQSVRLRSLSIISS
jgi:hypothetical protein